MKTRSPGSARHPNEFDLRRIARLLEKRVRYRYVAALVEPVKGGSRILSPCCSRSIDRDGGIIDIARLEYDEVHGLWRLYRKDHTHDEWRCYHSATQLATLMDCLIQDPARVFWQ